MKEKILIILYICNPILTFNIKNDERINRKNQRRI